MGKLSLKSVFAAPLIVISSLKKIKINGFVGGLIFGAIFSLVVNITTIQVQESIQRQRILEAIENEILSNMLGAKNTVTDNDKSIKDNAVPNMFHPFYRYSNDLWTQSAEPIQYVAQLKPDVQIEVSLYYTSRLKHINSMVGKYEEIADKQLVDCYDYSSISVNKKTECEAWNKLILEWEADTANDMSNQSYDVLQMFHPTQDRLNNWFLRLLMGDKSTRILSGK